VLVVVFILIVLVVAVHVAVLAIEVVVIVIVVERDVEFDRREAGDFEVRAAFGTAQLITLIDIELVDFNLGIALGTGSHTLLGDRRREPCGRSSKSDVPQARVNAIE
ncbi:MAG: hypothetical protein LBQ09_07670, partial [Acidobacteriaceae bacterium]|nr:hypothetical protein [Acidobacteriaceae bacterium]